MQTFRILLGVIVTVSASALLTQADDSAQQAAARAALMQQMGQLDTNPPPAAVAPAPAPVEKPKKASRKHKKSAAAPASTNEMMQAQSPAGANLPPITEQAPTQQAPTQQSPGQLPPLTPASPNNLTVPPVEQANVPLPPNASTNAMTEFPVNPPLSQPNNGLPPITPSSTPAPGQETPASEANPMAAPPLPISPAQQQELQDLLSRYMANQITSEQYQEDRAKILNGE